MTLPPPRSRGYDHGKLRVCWCSKYVVEGAPRRNAWMMVIALPTSSSRSAHHPELGAHTRAIPPSATGTALRPRAAMGGGACRRPQPHLLKAIAAISYFK